MSLYQVVVTGFEPTLSSSHGPSRRSLASLWVHSPPGYGKTVLASRVSILCQDKLGEETMIVKFFCRPNTFGTEDDEAANIMRHLLGIAWAAKRSIHRDSERDSTDYNDSPLPLVYQDPTTKAVRLRTIGESVGSLVNICVTTPTVIILDGLEVCDKKTRETVIYALHYIVTHCDKPMKVMVFSETKQDMVSLRRTVPLCLVGFADKWPI